MPSRHYKWQTRWRIDVPARTCTHDPTGLIVRMDRPPALLNRSDVLSSLLPVHGGHNGPRMLTRLTREALTLWAEPTGNLPMPDELDDLAEAVTEINRV